MRDVAIAAATIYDRRLGDVDRAYAAYRRALAIDVDDAVPDERELVRRLEDLLGRAQKWAELVAIYDDVIARGDDELRREALIKRARLLEDGLGDIRRARSTAGARSCSRPRAAASPCVEHAYREAVGELERLYRARGAVARARRAARGAARARVGACRPRSPSCGSSSPRCSRPQLARPAGARSISTSR